jgi:hypothetical protein
LDVPQLVDERVRTQLTELRDVIEFGGKLIIAILAIAYVAGLLIVNLYLRKYDLVSFGLVRAEYAMAGILWLVLLSVSSALATLCRWGWRRTVLAQRNRAWVRMSLNVVLMLVAIPVFATWPIDFLSGWGNSFSSWRMWIVVGAVLIMPWPFSPFFQTIRRAWQVWSARLQGEDGADIPIDDILVHGLQVIGAIGLYATVAYPVFLPAYGGGKPIVVRIVPSSEAKLFLQNVGFKAEAAGMQVALVAETTDWIVVAPPEAADPVAFKTRPTVRLRHDAIQAVVSVDIPRKLPKVSTPHTPAPTPKQPSRARGPRPG